MFQIIIDQLRFKKIPIGSYDGISSQAAWILMVLISIVGNGDILIHEKNIIFFVVPVILQLISIYIAYLIMVWWFKKKGYFDGNGNVWGLFATASSIDIIAPFVAMIHPLVFVVFIIFSMAIFFNALKSGFDLSVKSTIVAIVVVTVSAIILSFAGIILAKMVGVSIPPMGIN
jgi:hypothetical protein